MTKLPEAGRQAAHVLVDAVSLWDGKPDTELLNRALSRLNHVGAIQARGPADADLEAIEIDATHLVGGAAVSIKWLVAQLAIARGTDESAVVFDLRQFLDG